MRNSGYLFLLVLYTGNDTKLILNQGKYRHKMSAIDKLVNKILMFNILLMLSFCLVCSIINYRFVVENRDKHFYIFENSESANVQAVKAYGSFFLLNNAFIPIDLAVGLEMGKSMYIFFLHTDA